ncbi:MAG: hypothetical protein AAGJ86_06940 [Pseudomonadota bacterium]
MIQTILPLAFLIFGLWLVFRRIRPKPSAPRAQRLGWQVTLLGVFLMAWVSGAVGIIGSEDNPANLMFGALLAMGVCGAAISGLRPKGLRITLAIMAAAQIAIALVDLYWELGVDGPVWPRDVWTATAIFTIIWSTAAALFHRAHKEIARSRANG